MEEKSRFEKGLWTAGGIFYSAKQCHRRIRLFLKAPKLYTLTDKVTEVRLKELSEGLST